MGSQLLQNTEIINYKLTYYFGKSEENTDLSRIYLAVQVAAYNGARTIQVFYIDSNFISD